MREPKHISEIQMRTLLREAYSRDPEKSILGQFMRRLCDPAKPLDANSHSRIHPLWLTLGLLAGFVALVFVCFSFLRP
jgi:hypothetical protein